MNLYQAFEPSLLRGDQSEFLTTTEGKTWTRSDIAHFVDRLCGHFAHAGLQPGDRISVQVHKSVENLCLFLACLKGGYVFHPLNPAYQASELDYFIKNAEPVLIICDPAFEAQLASIAEEASVANTLTLDQDGAGTLMDVLPQKAVPVSTTSRQGDDLAALLYSSGTTGTPKGIALTHDNLRTNMQTLVEA